MKDFKMKKNIVSEKEIKNILEFRYIQHRINENLKINKITKIPVHLQFGYEFIAAALKLNIKKNDAITLTHRNILYNSLNINIKEIIEKYNDSNIDGSFGSMNLVNDESNVKYTTSILGNNLSIAAGIALSKKINKEGISIAFTGDGAIEEGTFWETALFASKNKIPLLIIIENNNMSMSSLILQRRNQICMKTFCKSISAKYLSSNSWDYLELKKIMKLAFKNTMIDGLTIFEINLNVLNNHAGPTPGWVDDEKNININESFFIKNKFDPLNELFNYTDHSQISKIIDEIKNEQN